jgi:flagellar biosynthesis protein FlhF
MQLKRYRGASVREALAHARAELGPTALVLSTRLVTAHGLRGWIGERVVEVTAATELGVSESRPPKTPERAQARPASPHAEPQQESPRLDPGLVSRLTATGLDRILAAEVASRVPVPRRRQPALAAVRRALEERLQWLAAADGTPASVQVFVGPPGAGKTTTIAKIAAQERARGGRRLGVVAADGFRVGAVEQLRLYAEIIGSPFRIARSAAELTEVVSGSQGPLLIDTAGRSPRDQEALDLFRVFASWPQARTHLVIPASTTPQAFERAIDAFAGANPTRVVFTKLDEADGIAPLIRTLRDRDLLVSYLTAGQRVPEDLEAATPSGLASCVLGDAAQLAGACA